MPAISGIDKQARWIIVFRRSIKFSSVTLYVIFPTIRKGICQSDWLNLKYIDKKRYYYSTLTEIIRTMTWQQMNKEARKSWPRYADLCNPQMIDDRQIFTFHRSSILFLTSINRSYLILCKNNSPKWRTIPFARLNRPDISDKHYIYNFFITLNTQYSRHVNTAFTSNAITCFLQWNKQKVKD